LSHLSHTCIFIIYLSNTINVDLRQVGLSLSYILLDVRGKSKQAS